MSTDDNYGFGTEQSANIVDNGELNKKLVWAIYEDGVIQSYYGKQFFCSEENAEHTVGELFREEPLVNHEYYVNVYPPKESK